MMTWFLRHYSTFADKIVVYDEQSNDGTREIVKSCPKAELREWPFKGLDDEKFLMAINSWWRECRGKFDWVAWPDVDELLYHRDPTVALGSANGDVVTSKGYALISADGKIPQSGQIYDSVNTGVPQSNYDKQIIWRSTLDIEHTIGRHTYPGQFPRHSGKLSDNVEFKLLHLHHLKGVEGTDSRNQRDYNQAVNKRYAWNYAPGHNDNPNQGGSVAWVKSQIEQGKLFNIMEEKIIKVQFCSGGNQLHGWDNRDMDCDITKPLPYASNTVGFILVEHGSEHVTHQQAWRFFEECYRILKPGGVLRVAIPDLERIYNSFTPEYGLAVKRGGHGEATREAAVRSAVFNHGHQAIWSESLLLVALKAIGFRASPQKPGASKYIELRGVEGHGKVVGENVAMVETSVVEGVK